MIDICFVNPGDRKVVFQDLGKDATALEPPYLTLSYASYLQGLGYKVQIIDANALNIAPDEVSRMIAQIKPRAVALIVYGNQPSASTQNMSITIKIAKEVKDLNTDTPLLVGGLHPSALPQLTLKELAGECEGGGLYIIEGEGPTSLKSFLQMLDGKKTIQQVEGLWYFDNNQIKNNPRAPLIRDLDEVMPIASWDLLPMDKYRAHNWHCFNQNGVRSPYASIYTSLGCPYACEFCCINTPFGKSGIRTRSPHLVVDELELLHRKYGVKNIKIIDEMFVLQDSHYMKIAELIIERGLDLNIWCYARVDTVKEANLKLMKKAGINWLALGIESANANVRDGAAKRLKVNDIKERVRMIQRNGICVMGNFIFGLPDDTLESMQETLDMAKELNCECVNLYCAMAYPGSKLYQIALKEGWELPKVWHGYSQHSYEMQPLPSKHCTAKEIVAFRDNAFNEYFTNPAYLDMIEQKFGKEVRQGIEETTKIKLKRKILE